MRIDLNSRLPESYGAGGRGKSGLAGSQAPKGARADEAHFSSEHQRVQRLEADPGSVSEVRRAKVAALRHAVANGSYAPSSEQIAGALLQEAMSIPRLA
jgi:flagellar biosynthesis anti-sigma factor FlgM